MSYQTQVDEAQPADRETGSVEASTKTDDAPVVEEKEMDAQTKGVLMINFYCIANTAQCVLYKIMSTRGVDLLEYTLFRNLTIIAIAIFLLIRQRRDPVQAGISMDMSTRKKLLLRAFLGYVITLLINMCLTMISFSLLVILFQTSPFWTSLLSYYYNGEPILMVEIAGMTACFVAVMIITMTEDKEQNELLTG